MLTLIIVVPTLQLVIFAIGYKKGKRDGYMSTGHMFRDAGNEKFKRHMIELRKSIKEEKIKSRPL